METTSRNPVPYSSHSQPDLVEVERRFAEWRRQRGKKRALIPQELWEAAVQQCRGHSVSEVCRRLRLSFTELKKRLSSDHATPELIQLDTTCLFGQWVVECERADGSRLRLSGTGQPPDPRSILEQFLS